MGLGWLMGLMGSLGMDLDCLMGLTGPLEMGLKNTYSLGPNREGNLNHVSPNNSIISRGPSPTYGYQISNGPYMEVSSTNLTNRLYETQIGNSSNSQKKRIVYDHYHKSQHSTDTCWEIHGIPID